ncbi:MAG: hypothetical protein IPG04_27510 [Polyangiaceae bacterium]|jgi:cysteine-rich repeat protein|nr:hypothetical protein [Polyangiaceae bacterium]
MRALATFTLVALSLSLFACGDDSPAPTGGGGAGGGSGGEPPGGGGGAGGGPALKGIGESCVDDDECAGGLCMTESLVGWASGYCTALCDSVLAPCAEGTCVGGIGVESSVCLKDCTDVAQCPGVGNECLDIGDVEPVEVCLGGCFSDDQCSVSCDDDLKLCTQSPEICDSGFDEDLDGLHDCAELDCITLPGCVDAIDDACAGATPLAFDTPTSGSTFGGSDVFGGVCAESGGSFTTGGGAERLYTVTAPAKGELTVTATPAMGDLGIYARTVCTAASAQVACSDDAFNPAATESFTVLLDAGTEVTIFVDAYGIITAGDFELLATFEPEVCGDGLITGDEQCDDAGTTSGDGCSATCAVEQAAFCASAGIVDITAGVPENGDNSDGTLGFEGSCGGVGSEIVYRYVPAADGMATITLQPFDLSFDGVLYARTACADDDLAAELDCADLPVGGEELEVAVTDGEPIFIFVDSYTPTTTGPYTLVVTQ